MPTLEVEQNVRYYGDELLVVHKTPNADQCYLHCADSAPQCKFFVYKKVSLSQWKFFVYKRVRLILSASFLSI